MVSIAKLCHFASVGAVVAAGMLVANVAQAAGPQVVSGPAADPDCMAPWAQTTKFFKYPAKKGPFRIALANGFVANTWRIQMIQTAKAYTAQKDVAAKLKEFKVVSTGEDVPAQISAINNFIDSGFDAIVVNAQNPTAFGPGAQKRRHRPQQSGHNRFGLPRRDRRHPGQFRTELFFDSARRADRAARRVFGRARRSRDERAHHNEPSRSQRFWFDGRLGRGEVK